VIDGAQRIERRGIYLASIAIGVMVNQHRMTPWHRGRVISQKWGKRATIDEIRDDRVAPRGKRRSQIDE
jgi:hypothetical protein